MRLFSAEIKAINMDVPFLQKPILLNIGMATHHADWNYTNITSPFFRIYLVLEGEAWLTINSKKFKLSKGNLYLIPPFVLHDDSCEGFFSLYYIHVFENNETKISLFDEYLFPIEVSATEFEKLLVNKLVEINPYFDLVHYDPQAYASDSYLFGCIARRRLLKPHVLMQTKGIINSLLSVFLKEAVKSNFYNDSRVYKAAQYIREHLNEKMLLKDIAGHCGVSEDHLIRLFRRNLNITPVAYINKKKIEQAQLKLLLGKCHIKDIAYSLSFDNLSYFNRVFRSIVGMTPTEYVSFSRRSGEFYKSLCES